MKTDKDVTEVKPDKSVNNFDWFDTSILGELTDRQKWKLLLQDKVIHLLPDHTPMDWRIVKLERYLFAFKLTEDDFTELGMLKGK